MALVCHFALELGFISANSNLLYPFGHCILFWINNVVDFVTLFITNDASFLFDVFKILTFARHHFQLQLRLRWSSSSGFWRICLAIYNFWKVWNLLCGFEAQIPASLSISLNVTPGRVCNSANFYKLISNCDNQTSVTVNKPLCCFNLLNFSSANDKSRFSLSQRTCRVL